MRVVHLGQDVTQDVADLTDRTAIAQSDLTFARLDRRELGDDHGGSSTDDHGDEAIRRVG